MNSIENEKLQQMNTPNGGYRLKQAVKDMINYGSPILVQFPRVEKYGLAKRIRETMYDMLHPMTFIPLFSSIRSFFAARSPQPLPVQPQACIACAL